MSGRWFWLGRGSGLLLLALAAGPAARAQSRPAAAPTAQPAGQASLLPLPTSVPLSGELTLGFRLRSAPLREPVPEFPDIEGFRKGSLRQTTATQLLPGGGRRAELLVRQPYLPYAEGDFVVPAFSLTVNGQVLRSPGGPVQVGAGSLATAPLPPGAAGVGSADQLLGRPKPGNFYEPPDAGTLAVEADRAQVYAGQGVTVSLYFYLRVADQAVLNFVDFNRQLTQILGQLRQPGAWEVAGEGRPEPDTLRPARPGQPVRLRFRLARRTYYPLAAQPLDFPSLQLTLTKFSLLKNSQPGDDGRLARYKTYVSRPLQVAVRPLPGPPVAAVGTFIRTETLSNPRPRTGEAFRYALTIEGQGNPAALATLPWRLRPGVEVFGPEVREETLADGKFRKTLRYRLLVRRPGPLPLDSLWQLPYFDPEAARYDTLRSALRPLVRGPAAPEAAAQPADDPYYGPALATADARLEPLDVFWQVRRVAAGLLSVLLLAAGVGWWRSRSR